MSDATRMTLDIWSEFRLLAEIVEEDVHKNAVKGNLSAGVRVRKGIRQLRSIGAELIKATLVAREEARAEKPSAAPAVVVEQLVEAAVVAEPEPAKKARKAKNTG